MAQKSQAEINVIKRRILQICSEDEFKVSDIANIVNCKESSVQHYCETLVKTYNLSKRLVMLGKRKTKTHIYMTTNPNISERALNSGNSDSKYWQWNPVGWMSIQPIEHHVNGRRITQEDNATHILEADRMRRREMKSARVYVGGDSLSMAV